MNRLNSEVSITAPEIPESAYPLYVDNLIYLPFARHLAEQNLSEEEEDDSLEA